jgi:predicted small lipoprotein YifL
LSARVRAAAVAVLLAFLAGCGQQGPLVLPEGARPVERSDTPPAEPEQTDDERRDER